MKIDEDKAKSGKTKGCWHRGGLLAWQSEDPGLSLALIKMKQIRFTRVRLLLKKC